MALRTRPLPRSAMRDSLLEHRKDDDQSDGGPGETRRCKAGGSVQSPT